MHSFPKKVLICGMFGMYYVCIYLFIYLSISLGIVIVNSGTLLEPALMYGARGVLNSGLILPIFKPHKTKT